MSKFLKSIKYDRKLLSDVLALDKKLYAQNFQGTFASVKKRFKAYPEMFIYHYDEHGELAAYICFFPITNKLEARLLNSDKLFDDNISHRDIIKNGVYASAYFIISVAVNENFQNQKFATALLHELLHSLKQQVRPFKIYAVTINNESEKLFTKFNFKKIKQYYHEISLQLYEEN